MNIALFHSVWTVLLLILFVGIVLWAYSSRRRQHFDAAARLPLEDEDSHILPLTQSEEVRAVCASARLPLPPGEGMRVRALSPTPLPQAGEGGSVRSEPSALRATSFTRGEKHHG